MRAAKNDGGERAGGMKRKKQTRVLTHPDKMEQGVSLGTSHTHANILHHQYMLYMRACLKDQAPGSELLLKATDARNTASHTEPRTKRSLDHTCSRTRHNYPAWIWQAAVS